MARFLSRARILAVFLPAFFKILLEDSGDIRLENGSGFLRRE